MQKENGKKKKIVALIPLRGGSKSIPYKNIKPIAGKPLAYWASLAAHDSKLIEEIYVSTEDDKIKETVTGFNLPITIINRPMELAQDNSSTESVLLHFLEQVDFDILVNIHATGPFTTAHDLDTALTQFIEHEYDSMITGTLAKKFYWTKDGTPLNYDPHKRPRRQEWEGTITENGAFYITKKVTLQKYKNFLGGKIGIYKMHEDQALDIDEPEDWDKASASFLETKARILNRQKRNSEDGTLGKK